MQKLVLYGALVLAVVVACGKDKFQDKPTIEIKSINPSQAPLRTPVQIDMEFTDKQGDLDSVFLYKVRTNLKQKPQRPAVYFPYKLPDFPEKSKGTIRITLDYNNDLVSAISPNTQQDAPNGYEPDSLVFKIIAKDKGGNVSDTTLTGLIVVERVP